VAILTSTFSFDAHVLQVRNYSARVALGISSFWRTETCFRAALSSLATPALRLLQMFPPLTTGASLVVATPKGHLDPSYIVKLVLEHGVNEFIFSVPTMVRASSSLFVQGLLLAAVATPAQCAYLTQLVPFSCRLASTSTS